MNVSDSYLNFKLDMKKLTSKIIKSPEANGDIYINKSIVHNNLEYKIISIDNYSFFDNKKLKTVKFSEDSEITNIFNNSFRNSSLEYICIPKTVKKIDDLAFFYCTNLKTVEFSQNSKLLSIGYQAFMFSSFDKIFIPSTVNHIAKSAFNRCKNLQIIEFGPKSALQSINSCTFLNCTSLTSICIPSSVTKISARAFMNCHSLRNVHIQEDSKLVSIENHSFFLSSLEKLFIPSKVTNLERSWCSGLRKLNDITISPHNCNFSYYDDQFILKKSNTEKNIFDTILFARCDTEKMIVPSFVTKIASFSFSYHTNLKTIQFLKDSEIVSIEKDSFSYSSLEEISIPCSISEISENAFLFCDKLKTIDIIESWNATEKVYYVTKFRSSAFSRCMILENIVFLENELLFENQCFNYCPKLCLVSCPNAECIFCSQNSFYHVSSQFSLFVRTGSKICDKI